MKKKRAFLSTLVISLVLVVLLLTPTLAAGPPAPSTGAPQALSPNDYYDSGWQDVAPGTCRTFNHYLGGDPNDYAVELSFLDEANAGLGIHRRGYGGLDLPGSMQGAHWQRLTPSDIQLCRAADADQVDKVRVIVRMADPPDYDSGWQPINPGLANEITFNHNLNVAAADLVMSLWFRDTSAGPGNIGIHQLHYGGIALNTIFQTRGAHWHHLTNNSVTVMRHPDDLTVDEVRVVVVDPDPPDYDSMVAFGGWKNIPQGTPFTFNHNLNWDKNQLLVRVECFSPTWNIHHLLAGGNRDWTVGLQGANMQRLQENTVQVLRWQNDQVCPQVHVRVWKRKAQIYVPLALHNDG